MVVRVIGTVLDRVVLVRVEVVETVVVRVAVVGTFRTVVTVRVAMVGNYWWCGGRRFWR